MIAQRYLTKCGSSVVVKIKVKAVKVTVLSSLHD